MPHKSPTFLGKSELEVTAIVPAWEKKSRVEGWVEFPWRLLAAAAWHTRVIFAVPCCQHELNPQLASPALEAMLGHGLLRERLAALTTDALRAAALECAGYKTQMLEFIDLERTPKNILIRAVRRTQPLPLAQQEERRVQYAALKQLVGLASFRLDALVEWCGGWRLGLRKSSLLHA